MTDVVTGEPALTDTIKFETIEFSPRFAQISAAVARAQALFGAYSPDHKGNIRSEKANFSYNYAKLPDVIGATRGPLNAQGVAVFQPATARGSVVTVETLLVHKDEWLLNRFSIKAINDSPMSIGSAMTYARRYALQALLCTAADQDDDGAGAQGNRDPHGREEPELLARQEADAVGWIEEVIAKRAIAAAAVVALVHEIAGDNVDDWRELNLEGKRRVFAELRKRFPKPTAAAEPGDANKAPGDAQAPSDDQNHSSRPSPASERSETNVLTASEIAAGGSEATAEMLTWVGKRLDERKLVDDSPLVLELAGEVSVAIDEQVTYTWRNLSVPALREFARRVMASSVPA